MYDRVLFPTDGNDMTTRVFEHVLDIAETHDAELHVLNVADTTRDSVTQVQGQVIDALVKEGEAIINETTDRATGRGISLTTEVLQGEPYTTILDYAEQYDIDLIVMPTHGRKGLERLLLGSVTERIIRRSNTPVLTIRPDDDLNEHYPYNRVLVPIDGSKCATAALELGIEIVNAYDCSLDLVSVVNVASLGPDVSSEIQAELLTESAEKAISEGMAMATESEVESAVGSVEKGSSVHETLLSYIDDHDIDLVVIGTHGRTGFDRYLLGSLTEKMVRTSPVPVLTVRGPENK